MEPEVTQHPKKKKQAGAAGSHILKGFLDISSNLNNNKYSGTTSFDPSIVFNFPGFAGLIVNMVSQINKSSLLDRILSLAWIYGAKYILSGKVVFNEFLSQFQWCNRNCSREMVFCVFDHPIPFYILFKN